MPTILFNCRRLTPPVPLQSCFKSAATPAINYVLELRWKRKATWGGWLERGGAHRTARRRLRSADVLLHKIRMLQAGGLDRKAKLQMAHDSRRDLSDRHQRANRPAGVGCGARAGPRGGEREAGGLA